MEFRKLIAAAALGTGAVFTSMAFAANDGKPKQSVGEYASDATVTTKVKAAFVADKQLSALHPASLKTVVVGWDGNLYLTDGHHTFSSLREIADGGPKLPVWVKVDANYSTVGTAAEADHAATVARGVEGVKQVMNNIKVDPAKNKK